MSPLLAASLSLVPGLGHLVLGKRGKALALFVVDFGMIVSVYFLNSRIGALLVGIVYFMAMVPAVIETYTLAQGGLSRFSESKFYIVALLLVTGFPALPLLWQSRVFSKRMKILWSIAVPALAILYFSFLGIHLLNEAKIRVG